MSAGTAQLLRDLVNPDPARRPRSAAALRPRVRDLIDGRGHIPAIKAAHAAPQKNNPTLLPDYLTEHDLPPLTLSSLPRPAVGAFAPHVAPLDGERRRPWWIVACATAVLGLVGLALMVS